jgi:hypothetical protein
MSVLFAKNSARCGHTGRSMRERSQAWVVAPHQRSGPASLVSRSLMLSRRGNSVQSCDRCLYCKEQPVLVTSILLSFLSRSYKSRISRDAEESPRRHPLLSTRNPRSFVSSILLRCLSRSYKACGSSDFIPFRHLPARRGPSRPAGGLCGRSRRRRRARRRGRGRGRRSLARRSSSCA